MSTTGTTENVSTPEKPKAVKPETTITGFVHIDERNLHEGVDVEKFKDTNGKVRRVKYYLHGLVVPGVGVGTRRNTGEQYEIPRNRMLMPDKNSPQWFIDVIEAPKLPQEVVGVGIKMFVKALLKDNIAFVRPTAQTLEQAIMEWRTYALNHRGDKLRMLEVTNQETLSKAFYIRASQLPRERFISQPAERGLNQHTRLHYESSDMFVARIFPETMTALAVMKNGYFYELFGAERLKRHIGQAGTNGVILDRDIESVFSFRQIYDSDRVKFMLSDPKGIRP